MRNPLANLRKLFDRDSNGAALSPLPTITDASEEHREAIEAAEREAADNLEPMPRQIGWDYAFAVEKKRILREKYSLNWQGPKHGCRD